MDNLFNFISELCFDIYSTHPLVNHGGCGIVAYNICREIQNLNLLNIENVCVRSVNSDPTMTEYPLEFLFKIFNKRNIIPNNFQTYVDLLYEYDLQDIAAPTALLQHLVCCFDYNGVTYVIDSSYSVMSLQDYSDNNLYSFVEDSWDLKYLEALIKSKNNWSNSFQRRDIPLLLKTIKRSFSDYKFNYL